jgi:hypothetical protein
MKTINHSICALCVLLLLLFTACKEASPSTEKEGKALLEEVSLIESPVYNPAKGAHIVEPKMTRMLADTLGIVMYEFIMKPGDSLAWHEHPHHTFYVLEGGTLAVYFEGLEKQVLDLPVGFGMHAIPGGDAAVNIGESTVKLLMHDIYGLNIKE